MHSDLKIYIAKFTALSVFKNNFTKREIRKKGFLNSDFREVFE